MCGRVTKCGKEHSRLLLCAPTFVSSMVRPSDLVIVRTSRSAQDFWSRVRDEGKDVSPDFKPQQSRRLDNSDTPFGRQQRPTLFLNPPLETSRVIERRVMGKEIDNLEHRVLHEENKDPTYVRKLVTENEKLRRDVERLEKENASAQHNLTVAWKLMNGLTGEVKRVFSNAP